MSCYTDESEEMMEAWGGEMRARRETDERDKRGRKRRDLAAEEREKQ